MTEHSKVRRPPCVFADSLQTVSALSIDPAGARFVTGGYDYDCKLFDFGGMDSNMKSFRSWEPCGSYQVRIRSGSCSELAIAIRAHRLITRTGPRRRLQSGWRSHPRRRRHLRPQTLRPRRPRGPRRVRQGRHVHPRHEDHPGPRLRALGLRLAPERRQHLPHRSPRQHMQVCALLG